MKFISGQSSILDGWYHFAGLADKALPRECGTDNPCLYARTDNSSQKYCMAPSHEGDSTCYLDESGSGIEGIESLLDHLDMKFSQMMKDQQEEIKQLTELVDSLSNKCSDQEKSINTLLSPPEVFYCGYRGETSQINSILTFDRFSFLSTNQLTGGLIPATGIFTSPYTGIYSITWSLSASNSAGDKQVLISLRKNGVYVGEESDHQSQYTGESGFVVDQGGRTLIIYLLLGDTLSMFCDNCPGVFSVNFCVSLVY